MAIHYSILAWRISWTEKPGGLQSMGSQRVRHDGVTDTFILSLQRKCANSSFLLTHESVFGLRICCFEYSVNATVTLILTIALNAALPS